MDNEEGNTLVSGDLYIRLGQLLQSQKAMHARLDSLEIELKANTTATAEVKLSSDRLAAEVKEPLAAWRDAAGGVQVLGWVSKFAAILLVIGGAVTSFYMFVKGGK